jgi:tripartite-type tricarboxylate transporter receptor subunit TctC
MRRGMANEGECAGGVHKHNCQSHERRQVMMGGIKRILFVIYFLVCLFLFQNINFVHAKDTDFPIKPIEVILTQGAGGSSDLTMRSLAKSASTILGQPIVIINKPGGNGSIAYRMVRIAAPDGYTLGNLPGGGLMNAFGEQPSFNSPKDFTYIMSFARYVYVLLIKNDAPWKNWDDFINWAKKNPRATKLGVTGAKSVDYKAFNMWQIGKRENAEFTHIVFKSSADMLSSLLGGHINLFASTIDASAMSYIKEGKLRMLAYIASQKIPGYENIPSLEDLYGVKYPNFIGYGGPRGIPAPVVKKLQDSFREAMKDPEFIGVMNRMAMPIWYMDSVTMTKAAEEGFAETAKIIERVKAEEGKKTN